MTELIWKGKRRERQSRIQAGRAPLPLRTLEILGEPSLGGPSDPGWRNKLIRGDNKYALASLREEFAGQINLIYLDPPFATGGNFSINIRLGGGKRRGGRSILEERAYRDSWNEGLDSYLQMIAERLSLMRDLLAKDGSIYVHLDHHAGHYVKVLLDEIFGQENFRNEIVWCYRTMQTSKRGWAKKHDSILFYTKGERYTFHLNDVLEPYPEDYERRFKYVDERGRRFMIRGKGGPFGMGQGDISIEDEKRHPGFTYRQYMQQGSIPKDWWEIEMLNSNSGERLGFETQKPEALLERIIKASSRPADLILDPFCGSGTTMAVAEKLGRRWIGCDLSHRAIQMTRKRLLNIPGHRPFVILALGGKYRSAKLKESGIRNYPDFILKLHGARPIPDHRMIHGEKEGRLVHIGKPDAPLSSRQIREVARRCAESGRDAVDILGWEFAAGVQDRVNPISWIGSGRPVQARLVQIPEEALEVSNGAKGGIKFLDLNRLELEARQKGKRVEVALKGLILGNPEQMPKEMREKIQAFSDCIDYWAVDFDYRGGAFRSMWQSFRCRNHPRLETTCSHRYKKGGDYRIWVKVVDLFGQETNRLLKIRI